MRRMRFRDMRATYLERLRLILLVEIIFSSIYLKTLACNVWVHILKVFFFARQLLFVYFDIFSHRRLMIRIVMSYIVAGLLLIDLICFPHFLPLLLANFSLLMILILLNRGLLNRSGWLRCDRLRWKELLQLLRRKVPIEHFVVGLLFRYRDQ